MVNNNYIYCREKVGWKVAKALKRGDDGISHAAIDMLCALMEPMHQGRNSCQYFEVIVRIFYNTCEVGISFQKRNDTLPKSLHNKKKCNMTRLILLIFSCT